MGLKPIDKGRPQGDTESNFMKVLHGLQTPLYITAGLVEEYQKREKGHLHTPYSKILEKSANNLLPFWGEDRQRTTYDDIVDDKVLAFGLNIFGDPITYVPVAGMAKLLKVGKYVTIKPAKGLIKGAARAVDYTTGFKTHAGIESISDAVQRAFVRDHDIKRLAGNKLHKTIEKYLRDVEYKSAKKREMVQETIDKAVPKLKDQDMLYDLANRRPAKIPGKDYTPADKVKLEENIDFKAWRDQLDGLSKQHRDAYELIIKTQDDFEKVKIEAGLLLKERAAGLIAKSGGTGYLPMYQATRANAIEGIETLLAKYAKGEPWAIGRLKTMRNADGEFVTSAEKGAELMRESVEEFKKANVVLTADEMDALRRNLPFNYPRKETLKEINTTIGEVLGIEASHIERGLIAKRYVAELGDWISKKGYMWDDMPTIESITTSKMFTPKKAKDLLRGGFERLGDDAGKEMAGKYVPKAIAGEVRKVMAAYRHPEQVRSFLKQYKNVQNMWKAWTLSIFPTYHARNHISNMWNNFLAGMNPIQHDHYYRQSISLMGKKKLGSLSASEKNILDEATRYGVLKSGFFRGEVGGVMKDARPVGKTFAKILHPRHNKAVKFGFATGNFIEDSDRLAHFLWARGKGMSLDDAGKSVNKYLFDYRYGLTPFEKKMFRDFSMPFYAWTRFNLPLQVESLAMKPGRFVMLPKGMRAAEDASAYLNDQSGQPSPNEMFMADWLKRATKIRLRWNEKTKAHEYFILDSWIPSADINKLVEIKELRNMAMGLLSPGIKLPIEMFNNYNLWRKRKIGVYKGQRGSIFGVMVQPHFEHFARSIRLLNEADKMYEGFIARSGEVSKGEAVTRIALGKVYPYRPSRQKKWWVWNMNKRVGELGGMRRYAEKRGWKDQVGILDGLIEEIKAERDYYKKLKVGR